MEKVALALVNPILLLLGDYLCWTPAFHFLQLPLLLLHHFTLELKLFNELLLLIPLFFLLPPKFRLFSFGLCKLLLTLLSVKLFLLLSPVAQLGFNIFRCVASCCWFSARDQSNLPINFFKLFSLSFSLFNFFLLGFVFSLFVLVDKFFL